MKKAKWIAVLFMATVFSAGIMSCDEDENGPATETNCSNGIDDDGDGKTDCNDGDCAFDAACTGVPTRELGGALNTQTLHPDTIYIVDRFVFVDNGQTVTILPGTILKAKKGDGAESSAFIVARGGKLMAEGTPDKPIIFTSVDDNIQPGETASTLNPTSDAGKWGGLVVLGKAPISARADAGGTETSVEGIPDIYEFSKYGGDQPADNSGVLRYVSIRFTGTALEPNNEIQGLTLGGVGNMTKIANIEILSSKDDGIEFFGGTVDVDSVLIVYQQDDGLDIDQSYRGTISNVKVITYNNEGEEANEIDGPEGSGINDDGKFTITNTTYVNAGGGTGRAANMKSGAQGVLMNSTFEGFTNFFNVDGGSAVANYLSEDLKVMDCEIEIDDINNAIGSTTADSAQTAMILAKFLAAGNTAVSPASFTKGSMADYSWTESARRGLTD